MKPFSLWSVFIIVLACVETPKLSDEKPSSQADLFSTIKKSEFTFDKNGRPVGCGPDSLDMFSVAVKVKFDSKIDMFNYPAMKVCTSLYPIPLFKKKRNKKINIHVSIKNPRKFFFFTKYTNIIKCKSLVKRGRMCGALYCE